MISLVVVLIFFALIIFFNVKNERKRFKSIDFKNKKIYLCLLFLYGSCNLKTNKAVLSRNGDTFLIETEDKDLKVESFKFDKLDILDIKVTENLSFKSATQLWNNFTSGDAIGRNTTFTPVKSTKYYKVYDIDIFLKNNIKIRLQSTKSPYFIFE